LFLSTLTSLPEIGSDAAFYFSSFEDHHMRQVFYESMKRYEKEKMQDLIKRRGAQFSWEEKAKEYLQVYKSLY